MNRDKQTELINDVKDEKRSDCCGWGTYGDNMICEHCGEHCGEEKN